MDGRRRPVLTGREDERVLKEPVPQNPYHPDTLNLLGFNYTNKVEWGALSQICNCHNPLLNSCLRPPSLSHSKMGPRRTELLKEISFISSLHWNVITKRGGLNSRVTFHSPRWFKLFFFPIVAKTNIGLL